METGDVVLTPGWCWHEHGHDGDEPAYWFDGLDVPLVRSLENMFYEDNPVRFDPKPQAGDDLALSLSARRYRAPSRQGGRRQRRLPRAAHHARGADHADHAADGGAAGRGGQDAAPALDHQPHLLLIEGSGETVAGDKRFAWQRGDTFAVPTWTKFEHTRRSDAQLFSMSDEPLMRFSPLLPVRSGLISRSISTVSLTFAKMTAVRARR